MTNDWIPFGQPTRYSISRSEYRRDNDEGWIIAWRPHQTAFHGIEYLLPNGRTFDITPGDMIEFDA